MSGNQTREWDVVLQIGLEGVHELFDYLLRKSDSVGGVLARGLPISVPLLLPGTRWTTPSMNLPGRLFNPSYQLLAPDIVEPGPAFRMALQITQAQLDVTPVSGETLAELLWPRPDAAELELLRYYESPGINERLVYASPDGPIPTVVLDITWRVDGERGETGLVVSTSTRELSGFDTLVLGTLPPTRAVSGFPPGVVLIPELRLERTALVEAIQSAVLAALTTATRESISLPEEGDTCNLFWRQLDVRALPEPSPSDGSLGGGALGFFLRLRPGDALDTSAFMHSSLGSYDAVVVARNATVIELLCCGAKIRLGVSGGTASMAESGEAICCEVRNPSGLNLAGFDFAVKLVQLCLSPATATVTVDVHLQHGTEHQDFLAIYGRGGATATLRRLEPEPTDSGPPMPAATIGLETGLPAAPWIDFNVVVAWWAFIVSISIPVGIEVILEIALREAFSGVLNRLPALPALPEELTRLVGQFQAIGDPVVDDVTLYGRVIPPERGQVRFCRESIRLRPGEGIDLDYGTVGGLGGGRPVDLHWDGQDLATHGGARMLRLPGRTFEAVTSWHLRQLVFPSQRRQFLPIEQIPSTGSVVAAVRSGEGRLSKIEIRRDKFSSLQVRFCTYAGEAIWIEQRWEALGWTLTGSGTELADWVSYEDYAFAWRATLRAWAPTFPAAGTWTWMWEGEVLVADGREHPLPRSGTTRYVVEGAHLTLVLDSGTAIDGEVCVHASSSQVELETCTRVERQGTTRVYDYSRLRILELSRELAANKALLRLPDPELLSVGFSNLFPHPRWDILDVRLNELGSSLTEHKQFTNVRLAEIGNLLTSQGQVTHTRLNMLESSLQTHTQDAARALRDIEGDLRLQGRNVVVLAGAALGVGIVALVVTLF